MLDIGDGVSLPDDYVTKTAAICAQRRKGKTYTASVIAEELVRLGHPWVAFDPTSAWWGLRASADGRSEGLPVVIIGGDHGDLPLDPAGGRFIADLVVDNPGWYVLDLSLLGTRAAERAFATDFADRLYRRKSSAQHRFPMHFFVDEADLFAPQDKEQGDNKMLGAFQAIVRRGGLLGLGCTLITQRPALLNKSVLTQLDLLILLRLVAGNDQDAVDKNYIQRAGSKEQRAELMGSLASMRVGEAWLWEPGAEPALFVRTRIRERHTFNSSATPKMGETVIEPTRLADVDLAAIKEQMADTIEKAKADDPKVLRARIAQLEREAKAPQPVEVVETVIERVEVPVLDEELVLRLEAALEPATALFSEVSERLTWATTIEGDTMKMERVLNDRRQDVPRTRAAGPRAMPVEGPRPQEREDPPARRDRSDPPVPGATETTLGKREKAILSVLAQFPAGRTHRQLAMLTGYSAKASTIGAGLSNLRKAGFVLPGNDPARPTEEGIAWCEAVGFEPLPTGEALLDYWMGQLGKRERALLQILVAAYPQDVTHGELCESTGYSPDASTVSAGMSKLRGLELADGWRASDDFMDAIGGR